MNFSSKSLLAFVAVLAVSIGSAAGCGSDDDTNGRTPDTSSSSSGESTSSSGGSSGASSSSGGESSSSSGGEDAGPQTSLSSTCDGPCAQMALTLTRGDKAATFSHAQFGFYLDGSLHIEHYIGGPRECPKDGADTPNQTLITTPPFPVDGEPFSKESGMGVGLVDFAEEFGGIPAASVTDALLTPQAARFVRDEDRGFFAYDLEVTFADGMVAKGHSYAEYCKSMDEGEN